MRKVVWLILLSIVLVGCMPNRLSHNLNNLISNPETERCEYDKLTGSEFVLGPLSQYDQSRYGYFHFYEEANLDSPRLSYEANVNRHGRLTSDIIFNNNAAFRKAILSNCQVVYIYVKRDAPYQLDQIEKSGVYFISTEMRLSNIRANLEQYIDKNIYAKAPIGYLYLYDDNGQKVAILHGAELLVKKVVMDLNSRTVYIMVKYDEDYLRLPYNEGYYLEKPSYVNLKTDLLDKFQMLTLFSSLVKNQVSGSFDATKNISYREISSFYFPTNSNMYLYTKNID
ncbi:hypothetical protein RHO15_06885 [Utexia brackfieldae]|uniref:hypothetical protein n=1 Tax=Utexia brackfieldae TaxID=3074108 RepID=UPI00370DDD4E